MNLTRNWIAGILLSGVAVWVMADNVRAQVWQEQSGAERTDWQQRVLKQHAKPQQWTAARHSANQYQQPAAPYQTARRNAFETASMASEAIPTPEPEAVDQEVVDPGMTQFEPMASEGVFAGPGGCEGCGGGGCDACCEPAYGDCCNFGWEVFDGHCGRWIRGLSVFAGADGFKGPQDRGANGNFGLNEGLNLARPLGDPWGCGYQIGANFVQSNFSGTPFAQRTDQGYRRQYFATAGIFRRADACGGFQWGIAYDYLHDIFYQDADLQQVRSETSFVLNETYDIGYYGAYGVGTARELDGKLDPTDMFVGFVRRRFENGGDGRIWFGATGNGDGLLGVDLWVPLGKSLALENRINYLIPGSSTDANSPNYRGGTQTRESWGLVAQLVWYPGQNAKCQRKNPYRPMFNVADNSLFMVDRLTNQ